MSTHVDTKQLICCPLAAMLIHTSPSESITGVTGGDWGGNSPRCPKYIFNKNAPNFFIFLSRTLLGSNTAAIQGPGVPLPPPKGVPQRQIPGYAYRHKFCHFAVYILRVAFDTATNLADRQTDRQTDTSERGCEWRSAVKEDHTHRTQRRGVRL